jgi:hypothetical protein
MKAGDAIVWWKEGGRPRAAKFVGLTSVGDVVIELGKRTLPVPLTTVFVRAEP